MNKYIIGTMLISSLLLAEDSTQKNGREYGFLGRTDISVNVGKGFIGDKEREKYNNDLLYYGISGSAPLNEHLQVMAIYGRTQADMDYSFGNYQVTGDWKLDFAAFGAMYHFSPYDKIDPYVALAYKNSSFERTYHVAGRSYDDSYSENTYIGVTGAEIDLDNSDFLNTSIDFSNNQKSDNELQLNLDYKRYLTDDLIVGGGVSYPLYDPSLNLDVGVAYFITDIIYVGSSVDYYFIDEGNDIVIGASVGIMYW